MRVSIAEGNEGALDFYRRFDTMAVWMTYQTTMDFNPSGGV
jgi:hypothetical protein